MLKFCSVLKSLMYTSSTSMSLLKSPSHSFNVMKQFMHLSLWLQLYGVPCSSYTTYGLLQEEAFKQKA